MLVVSGMTGLLPYAVSRVLKKKKKKKLAKTNKTMIMRRKCKTAIDNLPHARWGRRLQPGDTSSVIMYTRWIIPLPLIAATTSHPMEWQCYSSQI